MRTYDPTDTEEQDRLQPEQWMLDQLALNPSYVFWGPHEDYMRKKGQGWDTPVIAGTFKERFSLDDLNELVNFYFSIERDSEECGACHGTGHNPATYEISRSFYDFEEQGNRWCDNITEDEFQVLKAKGRAWQDSRESTNAANVRAGLGGHDAINRWILIEARARRLGVYGECEVCGGHGYHFTEDHARLALTLWILHPRKGCSRGVEIRSIQRDELPDVYTYLREAAERNAERFSKIPFVPVAAVL